MDAMQNPLGRQAIESGPSDRDAEEKVVCFVSKRQVVRSRARQVRHPKEGLVWVADELIK